MILPESFLAAEMRVLGRAELATRASQPTRSNDLAGHRPGVCPKPRSASNLGRHRVPLFEVEVERKETGRGYEVGVYG